MHFFKDGDVYKITRITGSQDNILGVSFSDKEIPVEVIEWAIGEGAKIKSSSNQVLEQVMNGLRKVNYDLGKNYFLSRIYFLPSDGCKNSVYELLVQELVKRFDCDVDSFER